MNVATLFLSGAHADRSPPLLRASVGRGSRTVGIALSLLAHAAVFAYAAHRLDNATLGAASQPSEAISIELAASSVIESVTAADTPDAAAQAAVAAAQGNAEADQEAAQAADAAPPPPSLEPRTEPTDTLNAVQPNEVPATDIASPTEVESVARKDEPAQKAVESKEKEKPREPAERPKERKRDTKKKQHAAESSKRGAQASRGKNSKSRSSARASASPGQIQNYAARVRAKVAGNKPPGNGHRGTVVVSFGVSSSGGLTYANVARSSGNGPLDRAALSAVRRAAPFGTPPPGSASRLRFSVPFHFQ